MHSLFWLLLIPVLLPLGGMVYQSLGAMQDRRRFLHLGVLIDVGEGRRVFYQAKGTSGPMIVFESGIAATSQNWTGIQETVSSFAHTFSYDRAGLGWSSAAVTERTPSNIASELRMLLQRAGVAPPYLLVGHSFGGLVVRRYALDYPEDVAAVLLVDAMRPSEWPPVNEQRRPMMERGIRMVSLAIPCARLGLIRLAATSLLHASERRSGRTTRFLSRATGAGGRRVVERILCEVGKMPRSVWPIVAAHWSNPNFYRGLAAQVRAVPASVSEMEDAEQIRDIPVLLLTPGTAAPLSAQELRRIGPRANQVIAAKSGHWIHLDEPLLVVEAIQSMLKQAEGPRDWQPSDIQK